MRWITFFILIVSLSSLSFPALATNFSFLQDSTVNKFNNEDLKMMHAATDKALLAPTGDRITWKNPATGHEGYSQPLSKTIKDGRTCRKVRIFNRARSNKDHYVFTFCKHHEDWKVVN